MRSRDLLAAPDILGTSQEIAKRLYADAAFREVREVVFAPPFSFDHADYVQILTDMATHPRPGARVEARRLTGPPG